MLAHSFHIPVMGLGYTIDTPARVARYGISSVVSIVEDNLIEKMRKFYSEKIGVNYKEITLKDEDYRARRITEYLNLIKKIVDEQFDSLKKEAFEIGTEIHKYFDLLPDTAELKKMYHDFLAAVGQEKDRIEKQIRESLVKGSIDVNIMTKLDKFNYDKNGEQLPPEFCDAMAALRGFANSDLESGIVFSAGLNPRLFSYCASFSDFFPNAEGKIKKQIILKVSDYRSALIQGKFLAKKGLWVSEFRVESGLNCGGHAFASGGSLVGPILEDFKNKREELRAELQQMCQKTWTEMGIAETNPELKITVQGGVGTAHEHEFLLDFYKVDSVGWGSPFLMVPEAVSIDDDSMNLLINAKKDDYFLSDASPLGVPFNNVKNTSSVALINRNIEKNRPGSACYKKFLQFNTEFTKIPICTASREYQNNKIKQMALPETPQKEIERGNDIIKVKECLCEGLASSALLSHGIMPDRNLDAVSLCPGPNLAYFSGRFSLKEMIGHIYGHNNLLNQAVHRPHVFVNEIELNIKYLKNHIQKFTEETIEQKNKFVDGYKSTLNEGIAYYKNLLNSIKNESVEFLENMQKDLFRLEEEIAEIAVTEEVMA